MRPNTSVVESARSRGHEHLFQKSARSSARSEVPERLSNDSKKAKSSLIASFHDIAADDPEEFLGALQKQRDRDRRRVHLRRVQPVFFGVEAVARR